MDEMWTEKDVAKYLKVSVKTVQAWRASGKGPRFRKLERVVRYSCSDVKDFADGKKSDQDSDKKKQTDHQKKEAEAKVDSTQKHRNRKMNCRRASADIEGDTN